MRLRLLGALALIAAVTILAAASPREAKATEEGCPTTIDVVDPAPGYNGTYGFTLVDQWTSNNKVYGEYQFAPYWYGWIYNCSDSHWEN